VIVCDFDGDGDSDGDSALLGLDCFSAPGLFLGKHNDCPVVKARLVVRLRERAVHMATCRLDMNEIEWRSDCDQSAYSAM
jgi:hypothetical protein